jgi:hypothetical protein
VVTVFRAAGVGCDYPRGHVDWLARLYRLWGTLTPLPVAADDAVLAIEDAHLVGEVDDASA